MCGAPTGDASWQNKFYLYEVEVYVRSTNKVEHNLVTDPYSFSLSTNSTRSQIVDLNDAALQPPDWTQLAKPPSAAPEDAVIYELHVRDFSINDQTVPETERGTFKAFTELNSNGMKHLNALAQAGLTHVHLLPAFDIATIEEDKTKRQEPDAAKLKSLCPAIRIKQQALVAATGRSGRLQLGLRSVSLHGTGRQLFHRSQRPDAHPRIPRDGAGPESDRPARGDGRGLQPHQRQRPESTSRCWTRSCPVTIIASNAKGEVETSTCCQNTATEHAMMEKLMIDSVVTWAKEYKVDGFRFDLMGHHLLSNMVNVRKALDALTLDKDGVDGKSIYIYGEGWDFGEMANNARGVNASQLNIGGTGIGVFNDRLRDARARRRTVCAAAAARLHHRAG